MGKKDKSPPSSVLGSRGILAGIIIIVVIIVMIGIMYATVTRGSSTPRFAIGKEGFIITVPRLKIGSEL